MHACSSSYGWHVYVFAEKVCVEETKACAVDEECSSLHAKFLQYKLQEAKKADGYGSKGADGKDHHDKKPKEYDGQDGEKQGSESYGGKGGDGGDGDKKPKQDGENNGNFGGKGGFGKKRRQLDGHVKTSDKDGEKKTSMNKTDMDKKDMGGEGGEEKEPSAELKAAVKACTENELCKQLMECMKKHTESGGKGDHGLRFEHHQQPK